METDHPSQRQPEVDEQIRRRAEAIALFMGGDYNMTVGVGPWGSGWHWDFVKNHVNMDAKDLATQPEDVVKGIAAHEGNHKAVSRTDSIMDMWQEPGFSFGFNAVEDPRANEGGMKFMPGTKKWIKAYIERDLSSGGGLDYQGMEKAAKDKMGYVPDFMKWGSEIIRYWHEKEFAGGVDSEESKKKFLSGIPDKEVRETVEKTIGDFEKYYKTLPDSKDEMEVRKKAGEAARNFRENMWPAYKELVKKSEKDQSLAKMLQDMMEQDKKSQQGQGQGQSGKSGQPMVVPFSSLPEDVQEEIKKKVEEAEKEAKKETQKGERQQDGQGGDQCQKGEGGEQQGGTESGSGSGETGGEKEDSKESGKGKIPWDKLSEKARKETEKAFDGLPQEKQEEYKEGAKKDISDLEDDANEKLRGKMNDPKGQETHREKEEREKKKSEREKGNADIRQTLRDMDEMVKKVMENIPDSPYQHFMKLPEVDAIRRLMERDLKKIFEPTESPDVRHTSSGIKPSMKKAMQMEADPRRTNIFESKGRPTERVFRFLFLIDLSGSMSGEKITETFKALIPILENLNHFGIEFEVLGYSSNIRGTAKVFKSFEVKRLDEKSREDLGRLLGEGGGGTPSMEAIKIAYAKLKQRISRVAGGRNYLVSLTDGSPTDCSFDQLAKYIGEIRKNKDIVTTGFGIGPDSSYVNQSYPMLPGEVRTAIARKLGKNADKIGNNFRSAGEFGEVFAIIAGYMVRRPELFFK